MKMPTIRLLLLDDHTLFRESLSRLLDAEPDFEMVADCSSVEQAIEILRTRAVDLVLLDYDLGPQRAPDFLERARAMGFAPRVLMVTAGLTALESVQVLNEGASGLFLKHSSPALLAEAIRKVNDGETWVDQRCLREIVHAASQPDSRPASKDFTERERAVLRGVFEGRSNKEIGARLEISESSVKAALQQLFHKTGVRTRSQLVRIALEQFAGQWSR
jgi:DNA-binding NarL/FixJ family response regulator